MVLGSLTQICHSIAGKCSTSSTVCTRRGWFFPHWNDYFGLIQIFVNVSVQMDMDLPMIAVIGSQSAGKSSLIESISGITLPRSAGTCTR